MRKKALGYFAFAVAAVMSLAMLCGCGSSTSSDSLQVYESNDGWKISYDAEQFTINEDLGDGAVSFAYNSAAAGTDAVIVSYASDMMPDAALYERVAGVDDSQVQRSEGMFGSGDYWAHTRTVAPSKDTAEGGDAVTSQYTAIEHNGGSVLIEVNVHEEDSEEAQTAVNDAIAGLLGTLELVDHQPQTEYAYIVGTYSREYTEDIDGQSKTVKETVVFKDDHTCDVTFQDTVTGDWDGTKISMPDATEMEYTVEGDTLYLNVYGDSSWVEFTRE